MQNFSWDNWDADMLCIKAKGYEETPGSPTATAWKRLEAKQIAPFQ